MKLEQFIKAHTQLQKQKLLVGLNQTEKETLILEQEKAILKYWDSCEVVTNKKLLNKFLSLEDQIMKYDELLSFVEWTYNKYTFGVKTQKNIYQWDIFYCNLGHNLGNEKNKERPVLIIQKTKGYLQANTLLVAPITIGDSFNKLYKHEIIIDETFKSKIRGKVDLSHIRAVDRSRLDEKPKDRLLKFEEYKEIYKGEKFVTAQEKIKKALSSLFCIDN